MKISDRRLRISDSLKISDFSNSLMVLQHPEAPPAITITYLVALTPMSKHALLVH